MANATVRAAGSPWLADTPTDSYTPLRDRTIVQVAVIGAGITGTTLAYLLAREGIQVALIDKGLVSGGATGYTTAKVSSQHGMIYDRLKRLHGAEHARVYGEANEAALAFVAGTVEREGIDCDWRRRESYAYVTSEKERGKAEAEARAAAELGLPAALVQNAPLPYDVTAAVRFERQAEFHPRKYVLALARAASEAGAVIAERTRALSVTDGEPIRVDLDTGAELLADTVIVASHYPMIDRTLAFARMSAVRSYCIGCRIDEPPPPGMFISAGEPTRSVRAHPLEGEELLIIGGEGHKVGQSHPTAPRYEALERFACEHFAVRSVEFRWSTQDPVPADGIPLVGAATPLSNRVLIATGFAKWGMTGGTAAAMILADRLLDRENPWAATFTPGRLRPRAQLPNLVKENANVGLHFVGDRLKPPDGRSAFELAPGEGAIIKHAGRLVGAHRDEAGNLHGVSPVCTHLGCRLAWNDAERSWDCPCHGSRFDPDGAVLEGPAVKDLDPEAL